MCVCVCVCVCFHFMNHAIYGNRSKFEELRD